MQPGKQWKAPSSPTNETEYEIMMQSLDQHLAEQDLHIHQRPVRATLLLSSTYGAGRIISIIPAPRLENHPAYSAEYLCARAHAWYQARYGEAVKTRPEIGYFLVPLQHRTWKVRAPFFYGEAEIYIDRRLGQEPHGNVISRDPARINILDCFEGMTSAYSNSLKDEELIFIDRRFETACDALSALDLLDQGQPLFRQARVDYNHSVEALCSVDRSYGKARRDTATCAEKVMKGILTEKIGGGFKLDHKLVSLAKLLNEKCGLQINLGLAEKLYTAADVSYEVPVTKQEALDAHVNLLTFLAELFPQIVPEAIKS